LSPPDVAAPVELAIGELDSDFDRIEVEPDGAGGAFLTIKNLELGEGWKPPHSDIAFQILFNYPYAPVYPFYVTAALERADGGAFPQALQRVTWRGREAVQVSLRANRWQPQHDNASGAVTQVRHWFQTQGAP
jgi:Prokaryotic E2 family E